MLKISPITALIDNYIWLISRENTPDCAVVDPGEAAGVIAALKEKQAHLVAILITHHHWDHTQGIQALIDAYPHVKVFGSSKTKQSIPLITDVVTQDTSVSLETLGIQFRVIPTPGHTHDHICYYTPGILFCGDTLFTGGCGRLLQGTAEEMLHSLDTLAQLPDTTQVYCAHEYTEKNLDFASRVEPGNQALEKRIQSVAKKRQRQEPTVPASLATEKASNPFLRCQQPQIMAKLHCMTGVHYPNRLAAWTALRQQKDQF